MGNIIMWGKGLKAFAEEINPDLYKNLSPEWGKDFEELSPWLKVSRASEDVNESCWVSSSTSETPKTMLVGPCSSCFDLAWYFHGKDLLPEWGSVLTPSQWAGRGQFGRAWGSPVGNIYGVLRLPLITGPWAAMVSIMMGYLLVKGFEQIGVYAQLKWPNDILVNGQKIGGVLIEEKYDTLMAGIGLNLVSCPSSEEVRHQNVISPGALNKLGYGFKPLSLWVHLVQSARSLFGETIRQTLPDYVVNQISSHMAFIGCIVRVEGQAFGPCEGEVLGLSSHGGLKLLTSQGVLEIRSGSIHPRIA